MCKHKFLSFEATKYVVICHGTSRKRMQYSFYIDWEKFSSPTPYWWTIKLFPIRKEQLVFLIFVWVFPFRCDKQQWREYSTYFFVHLEVYLIFVYLEVSLRINFYTRNCCSKDFQTPMFSKGTLHKRLQQRIFLEYPKESLLSFPWYSILLFFIFAGGGKFFNHSFN